MPNRGSEVHARYTASVLFLQFRSVGPPNEGESNPIWTQLWTVVNKPLSFVLLRMPQLRGELSCESARICLRLPASGSLSSGRCSTGNRGIRAVVLRTGRRYPLRRRFGKPPRQSVNTNSNQQAISWGTCILIVGWRACMTGGRFE
jgi:hypothetical protein